MGVKDKWRAETVKGATAFRRATGRIRVRRRDMLNERIGLKETVEWRVESKEWRVSGEGGGFVTKVGKVNGRLLI